MKTKTILIPTDFSVSSLSTLKSLLSNNTQQHKYNIVLLHGYFTSDSVTDLLFFSKTNELRKLMRPEFKEALMVLKNKYASDINNIREDLFTGYTQRAFDNYVEANAIEEVYLPENYSFASFTKQSFSLLPFITNCTLKVNGTNQPAYQQVPEAGQVAEILLNPVGTR